MPVLSGWLCQPAEGRSMVEGQARLLRKTSAYTG